MSQIFSRMKPSLRRTFGIDPGLASLGWAVVEHEAGQVRLIACGCLTTASTDAPTQRLRFLHDQLANLFKEHQPHLVSMEKLLFTKNVTSGIAVGQARGVAALAVAEAGLPLREFTPTAVKQTVTGDGRADKRQIQQMIKILLRLPTTLSNDNTADAVAIALCGAQTIDFSS